MNTFRIAALLAAAPLALAANSAPVWVPPVDTIPAPQDRPYPGTIGLKVDATDLDRRIFSVEERIPVATGGRTTLLLPKWLPGTHAPRGQIEKLAGLVIKANGKTLPWTRDPVDVFAFTVDVPDGAANLDVSFRFLSATDADQGRVVVTPDMLNLQWEAVSLYPAGYYTRQIPIQATVTYPKGWRAATALRGVTTGDTVKYDAVSYDVLQDSPVYAGRYHREDDLGHNVTLNTIADDPKFLVATPAQIVLHRNLVDQAVKLFGARHFDHYDFLFSLSDKLGGNGLEHHRSSENGVDPKYFTDWEASLPDHNLLPHEFAHSWDGKFRRGQDLWTPDFRAPMRDSLLWVYEGQTQFWGYVLEARSGLASKPQILDALASIAAGLDNLPARDWRPMIDTTNDPVISARKPKGWGSFQRSEDYYNEGMMIWLEADAIIRKGTKGARGMDDFARAFFGMNDGDYGELTYTIDDVAQTLNGVYPSDWKAFLTQRLNRTGKGAPLDWVAASGYELRYDDTPSVFTRAVSASRKSLDLNYSLGITVSKPAGATVSKIGTVMWDGPAYKSGLTVGQELVAVNDRPYSDEALTDAVKAAKGGRDTIRLTTKSQGLIKTYDIRWNGGLRYPHLVKIGKADGPLDKLLAPRA